MTQEVVIPVDSAGNYLTGYPLPLGNIPATLAYAGGFISTITVEYYGNTYVQTFLNNGTDITSISGYVLQ